MASAFFDRAAFFRNFFEIESAPDSPPPIPGTTDRMFVALSTVLSEAPGLDCVWPPADIDADDTADVGCAFVQRDNVFVAFAFADM